MADDFDNLEVLIVEDSPTQALTLVEQLEKHRMKLEVAVDGIEALKMLQTRKPQLVISDIEMPNMDGYQLCKMMKAHPELKKIPVILLTNLRDSMDVIRGIECGANSFLTKPCDVKILLSTIKDSLENKELSREALSNYQMEFYFKGKKHLLQVGQMQITELLLSTYANAVQKNVELEAAYKQLNQVYSEVKEKNEMLSDLNAQKNKFLGMAAHDMRNPLGAIQSLCDLTLAKIGDQIDPKTYRNIERIKSNSAFMLQLINELLDISVIESGILNLSLAEVDLRELIVDTLEYLMDVASKKHIHIEFKYDRDHSKIHCDPNKIMQVITNLITNSIKFSHPGSSIELILKSSENEVILTVKDSGVGISEEAKKRLFQPFAKGAKAGTGGEYGSGLGLAIVHRIITEHKGSIRVDSELGKGTSIYVTLPTEPMALKASHS